MKNLYNGNISETLWRTNKDNVLRSYGYTYDDLNRLRNAQYLRPVNPLLPNTNLNPIVGTFNESMQYDKNGNIVALQRNGGTESQSPALPIDNLIYNYDGNQLTKVDDSASVTDGFKDGINAPTEYTYDLNGNMTTDQNKGISSITYNHLNLPTKIIMAGGNITYVYNALGQKVSKTVSNSTISPATTSNTQYFGGFQYNNSILQFFPTAEGYVKNTVVSGANTYDYIFNYTDHLGNIRLSYGIAPGTQLLTIFEENNYYPFGLKHGNYNNLLKSIVNLKDVAFLDTPLDVKAAKAIPIGPDTPKSDSSTVANSGYQYKYNGKELQDELGLNMYDYGARNYDAAIGRMNNMDALGENYYPISPYSYALNNPNYFIDPDGNYIEIYYGKDSKEHQKYEYQKDRDYSKIDSPFLADALKTLDAVYAAANIEVDSKTVNIMDGIMNSDKELSVAKSCEDCGSNFSPARKFTDRDDTSKRTRNNIGTIYFDNKNGVLFDDVKDSRSDVLQQQLATGKFAKTAKINSPTSLFGHEMGHAFGFFTDPTSYWQRKEDTSGHSLTPYFKNKEEARATTLSTQINIQLRENPRLNHRGTDVPTQGVLSNKIKR